MPERRRRNDGVYVAAGARLSHRAAPFALSLANGEEMALFRYKFDCCSPDGNLACVCSTEMIPPGFFNCFPLLFSLEWAA